jgi:peptidoglycan/xylan/chitin deacetylase (PgdA/CDA1 family)
MFDTTPITGDRLPDHTLVLTYDDGPGPNTLPIAEYLSSQAIAATFFVVGQQAQHQPQVLSRVRALGHRLGNHTWTHDLAGLPGQLARGGDVVDEMRRTAALLDESDAPIVFRAPYGAWDSSVAAAMNADRQLAARHIGPFHWDIDRADWAAWRDNVEPNVAAVRYRVHASTVKRGIILLHDFTADYPDIAAKNRTYELTRALVPMLLADGFSFAPLDRVIATLPATV